MEKSVRMKKDWIVCGEKWKKNKTYPAAENEFRILTEELKVAVPVDPTRK